jgi:hypothetical protein
VRSYILPDEGGKDIFVHHSDNPHTAPSASNLSALTGHLKNDVVFFCVKIVEMAANFRQKVIVKMRKFQNFLKKILFIST